MFEDDIAIYAKSPIELQKLVYSTEKYSFDDNCKFNINKSVILFNVECDYFMYQEIIPRSNHFQYLVIIFSLTE